VTKRERFAARISPQQKERLQHAADLEGRTLSDFVIESAERAAEDVIRKHEVITLSARDSRRFVGALLDPSPPSDRLRDAAAHYRRMILED
jgi:uncharacterized protein (DUF1778 family)